MPKVAVLMSVYNGARFLRPSIESVLGQSEGDFEFLVVDDASRDSSVDIVRSYDDPRIRFFTRAENQGLFRNLNFLANKASSPLLKLWAQDDVMAPECLARGLMFYKRYPEAGCFYGSCDYLDIEGRIVGDNGLDSTPELLEPSEADWYSFLHGCLAGNISNLFIPARSLTDVGGFRDCISGDFDIMVRLQENRSVGRIVDVLVHIRKHAGQWSLSSDSAVEFVRADVEIYRRLVARVVAAGRLRGEKDAQEILAKKFAENYFHTAVKLFLTRRWAGALAVVQTTTQLVPARIVAAKWLIHLPRRLGERLAR